MSVVDLPLLPLGKGRDLDAERGVECLGDLPAACDPDLVARARAATEALGERVFVLGHHYQRDEVIQFADVAGDSLSADIKAFCGRHGTVVCTSSHADVTLALQRMLDLPGKSHRD